MSTKVRRRDGGYGTFPNRWIDAGYMAKAPGSVTQVYLFLCRWADNGTLEAGQTISLIAKKTGLTENVVRKAVRILEAWAVVERHYEPGRGNANVWILNELHHTAPEYPSENALPQNGMVKDGMVKSGTPLSTIPYQPEREQPVLPSGEAEPQKSQQKSGKARREIPEDWMPGDKVYAWADGESILAHEVDEEVEPFKDYYRSRGETFANIDLAFRNWLRRSKKFRRNQKSSRVINGATEDEWDAWERKNGVGKYAPIETEGRMR